MLPRMRTLFAFGPPVLLVLVTGSCKPAVTAPPPPEPPKLGRIEAPEDLVAELLVRDPHTLLETTAHATGSKNLDPSTFAQGGDPDFAAILAAVDLHAPAGAVVVGDMKNPDSWHYGIAMKLRDPKAARATVADKVAKGQLKSEDSPAIRAKIYPAGKTVFALIGEAIVFSDSRSTIETTGRWIAKEGTEGTPPHDVIVRVPISRYSVALKNELKKLWDNQSAKEPETAAAGAPFADQFLGMVAGMGDLDLSLDLEKEDAIVDVRLAASGMFSQWLAKYPAGPARSVLTMPRGNSAFVVRFPDSVADLFKSVGDAAAKSAQPSKELEDYRAFARTVGHEFAFATLEKKTTQKTTEALMRVELVDPVAAKKAVAALIADATAKPDRKVQRAPYAKFGAEGESIQYSSGSEKYDARWAIKGNLLYVDIAWEGKATLLEAALDPSGKQLLSANPRAKTFADRLPKDGLAIAYYAETAKAPKLEELGAVPALTGVRWGWASASKDGVASQFNIPLADLGAVMHEKKEAAPPVTSPAPPAASASGGKHI